MIKEMFVSSTPHETKVAVTEDDQLAEIFYERENEYTLAGSIYKGRVTRVLPGMQSAFVDIGLERDAFLYVSDFLDLGTMEEDEEIEEVPIRPETYVMNQPEAEPKHFDFLKTPSPVQQEIESVEEDFDEEGEEEGEPEGQTADAQQTNGAGREFRGGRRRRRGRRGRGFPETKFARPGSDERYEQRPSFEQRPHAFEGGQEHRSHEPQVQTSTEQAGYEPVVLPGESISKYRRGQQPEATRAPMHEAVRKQETIATVADVPPEHTHEPVPIIEDSLPQPEPVADYRQSVPEVLPGESLRKYRRNAEPERTPEPAPEATREHRPAQEQVSTTSSYRPSTLVEHPAPAPENVVLPFVLPGESLRKYQKTEHSQPDSPVSEHGSEEHAEHAAIAASDAEVIHEAPAEPASVAPTALPASEPAAAVVEAPVAAESVTPADAPVSVLPVTTPATPPPAKEEEKEPTEASVRMDTRSQVAPFVLPGESLRKYSRRRKKDVAEAPPGSESPFPSSEQSSSDARESSSESRVPSSEGTADEASSAQGAAPAEDAQRFEQMNVASVFAGEESDRDTRPTAAEREVQAPSTYGHDIDSGVEAHEVAEAELHQASDRRYGFESPLASLPTDEAQSELADARPQFTDDEKTVEQLAIDEAARHRRERLSFEPTPAGTMEHEEIDSDDIPDDEHDFRAVNAIGTEEDALFDELEETTLAPQAAEALNDERPQEPFVIEGGYEFEHAEHGAGLEEPDEEVIEEEEGEEEAEEEHGAVHTSGAPAYPQRRPFDRRRGRRGGRRGNFPGGGGGRPPRRDTQRQNIQIADLLKEGQEVLIQIAKEPIGKKGARITSHIALPGRFLVYMPTVNHIGVSRKINSEEERQRLKRIMISEREGGHGGFIVRTAAAGITEEELRADIRFLKNLWNEIRTRAENSKPPALIYHDLNLVERVLRDQVTSDFATIWVDTEQEYERILRFANRFQPSLVRKVKLYTKETPLYEQFGIQDEINKGLRSKVWLKSGGYIVINQTEALVAIDINTGKYVGKTTRLEDTIVKTNIDAIKEIVRQIRLRDLGGIIVIDFIDMDERKNRQKVMQALEEALKADRAPSKVLQFNDFGLVAITRKRVKQSLERTLGQPCPYCTGNGFVKSVTTVCNEIYVEARKLARHLDKDSVILRVNPEVAKTLKANGAKMVNELEELTGRTVIVKPDALVHTEQFDFN